MMDKDADGNDLRNILPKVAAVCVNLRNEKLFEGWINDGDLAGQGLTRASAPRICVC